MEHKRFAVAVHYREVAPERVAEIVAATYRLGKRMGLRASTGRKVIELRPDIEWDKGATLAWIRGLIDETGSLLPVYLGDDLTDEAAFDAVRFDGIGIVVRRRRNGPARARRDPSRRTRRRRLNGAAARQYAKMPGAAAAAGPGRFQSFLRNVQVRSLSGR
ncbi:MAG: trehalose-phosphatase [Mycobacterium sp.]